MLYALKNKQDHILYEKDCESLSKCLESAVKDGQPLPDLVIKDATIKDIDLSGVALHSARFENVRFENVNMEKIDLTPNKEATFGGDHTIFTGCSVNGCNLDKANLYNVIFSKTAIENSPMRDANLSCTEWRSSTMKGGSIAGANVDYCTPVMFNSSISGLSCDGVGMDAALPNKLKGAGCTIANEVIDRPDMYRLFGEYDHTIFTAKAGNLTECLEAAKKQKAKLAGKIVIENDTIENADLTGLVVPGLKMKNVTIKNSKLDGLKLSLPGEVSPEMEQVTIENSSLRDAGLNSLKAKDCRFEKVDFKGADISSCSIRHSTVKDSDFRRVEMRFYNMEPQYSPLGYNWMSHTLFDSNKMEETTVPLLERNGAKVEKPEFSDPRIFRLHDTEGKTLCEIEADNYSKALEKAVKADISLRKIDLSGQTIEDVDLSRAKMKGARIANSTIRNVNLEGAEFTDMDYYNSASPSFAATKMENVNLTNSNVRGGTFKSVEMKNVSLDGTNFEFTYVDEKSSFENCSFVDLQHKTGCSRPTGYEPRVKNAVADQQSALFLRNIFRADKEQITVVEKGTRLKDFGAKGDIKAFACGGKAKDDMAFPVLRKMLKQAGAKVEQVVTGKKAPQTPSLVSRATEKKLYSR